MIANIRKVSVFVVMSLCACTQDITPHLPPVPATWSADRDGTAKIAAPEDLTQWWKQFNDDTLNWLIAQTLVESPDIRQAQARIDEARGLQKSAFAALFPLLTANADGGRSRSLFFSPITANTYDASFDASYEIDVFGKNRAASKAADAATLAITQDSEWIKLSIIAEVSRNYISMRAAEKQIALAKKNLNIENNTLQLTTRERNAGGSSDFDVQRTALQVNQSAARIADYRRLKDIYVAALTTLTGLTLEQITPHIAQSTDIPGIDLTAVIQTPASVIARRPDIVAANLRFEQSTSLKASQAASIYPNISISGLYGISQTAIVSSNNVWNIGGTGAVNLLDFGRIQGQIDAASAREVEAYEAWRKAILQGLQDVETALTNVSRFSEQRVSLQQAKHNAGKAVQLAKARYNAGDESLLDVLDAQRQQIIADSAFIDAENNYVTSIIALYKALGHY